MIWLSRDLRHWISHQNQFWNDSVALGGVMYKRLTPEMFAALYSHMRSLADSDRLTEEMVERFTRLEQTICRLGLKEKYYALCTTNTQIEEDYETT